MNGYYYQLVCNGWFYSKENRSSTTQDYSVYEFKDYKKTWSLTREDLENDK